MNVTIDGKTYPTMGDFVFGPDISENSACKNAENRAKEMIIRKVSPEVLSANTDMKCTVKTEKIVEKEIEPIKETIIVTVPPIGSIVSSEIEIVKPHKVITYQDGFNSYVGDDSTIQLNATYQKGIITGIALELMRWIH